MGTLAGSGAAASVDGTGASASIWTPTGLSVDTYGSIYVVELGSGKLRKISPSGTCTTIAIANLPTPLAVVVDWLGNLFAAATGVYAVAAPARMASTASAPVCDATWHHLALTMDASNNAVLFVDGAPVATTVRFSLNVANGATAVLALGAGGAEGFAGAMHDVRVYSSNISAGDVLALSQPPVPALVANSAMSPPALTPGAPAYYIGCVGGYAGPSYSLSRGADGSFTSAGSAAALTPTSCALCGPATWAAPNSTSCTTCAYGAAGGSTSTGASTPDICASASPTPSTSPTLTPTPSVSLSPTISTTSTGTLTATPSQTPSVTASPSSSSTPSLSSSPTPSLTASPTPSQTQTPSVTPVPDVLLSFSFSLTPASGQMLLIADMLVPSVQQAIVSKFAALLGVPVATVRVANISDVATGVVNMLPAGARRLGAAVAGSQGVSVSVAVNLGHVTRVK